jgi:hypothetical protein
MTPEDQMVMAAAGYLACVLALAALVWPWYRAWGVAHRQDWRGEGGTEGQR